MTTTTVLADRLVGIFRDAIVALVRREGRDLSTRQLAVFLTCYLEDEAQTVRGLAAELHVSRPAVTRVLDRLSELDLVRRKADPRDRRSVLVHRTARGAAFLRSITKATMAGAAAIDPGRGWPGRRARASAAA